MDNQQVSMDRLFAIAVAINATEMAVFSVDPLADKSALTLKMHVRPDDSDAKTRSAAVAAFVDLMMPCIEQARNGAIEVAPAEREEGSQYCLIVLSSNRFGVIAAAGYIRRERDQQEAIERLHEIERLMRY